MEALKRRQFMFGIGGGGPVDGQCREVVRHDMRNVVSVHDNNDERY